MEDKKNVEYEGKEFGTPFEQIVYWATHSGWRYCQGGKMCGNEVILKLSHFNYMVNRIIKESEQELKEDKDKKPTLLIPKEDQDYFNRNKKRKV